MKNEDDHDGVNEGRRGIQSVEIGLRVIEALRRSKGPQSLSELARASELPTSNCHRYLVSFIRAGFLQQNEGTGRYDFGPNLLQAGLAALARLDPVGIGTEALTQLVEETGHTALLAIWGERGAVIVRWMPGRMAVRTTMAAGSTLPLLSSATGRVFLACLPERETAALEAIERAGKGGLASRSSVEEEVGSTGIAQISGEHIPGLSAASAPLLDAQGNAAAVISLVGLSEGFETWVIDKLKSIAQTASGRLGWTAEGRS